MIVIYLTLKTQVSCFLCWSQGLGVGHMQQHLTASAFPHTFMQKPNHQVILTRVYNCNKKKGQLLCVVALFT